METKFWIGTPLGRYGTDKDIKGVALFLAAPASDFVTGEVIVVDGGALTY